MILIALALGLPVSLVVGMVIGKGIRSANARPQPTEAEACPVRTNDSRRIA